MKKTWGCKGNEELVRAYILTKLVNELSYKPECIELEKEYDIGRPKVNKPRIDIIVKDSNDNPFLFIELKNPEEYEKDKDEIIEKQLFNLASQEKGQGKKVKYLVLYTNDLVGTEIKDKCMLIDYEKFDSFDKWKEKRDYIDQIPKDYNKAYKKPYIKGSEKDLEKNFFAGLDSIRMNLHNVLWGGGATDDNDVFSSLVNIILAKIQDEYEKRNGDKYEFQIFAYENGETFDTNEELFERINNLYKRALKEKLNIHDKKRLEKSNVIDENKFSLNKLKYTVQQLESFSFIDSKNTADGKDFLENFFEGIIRDGFKQNKGQFFTPINIVRFILWGLQLDKLAIDRVNKDQEIPYLIDPSAGSGTFLIEYMKFITENLKRRFKNELEDKRNVVEQYEDWFSLEHRENKWAKDYIYGIEHNFNLGTATKVNMLLHGDGSANIFVSKDGLAPFKIYTKETAPNYLNQHQKTKNYTKNNKELEVNEQFDVIVSNPPFSVDLDNDTKKELKNGFIFSDKKNSENLFIERWYQLLKPNGRLGVVLPESVFDTTENKYIRLFLYKYFKIKAIVSLPQLTFEPFTSTKTSLLFAQKKTSDEIKEWNELWNKYSNEWNNLKTRCENLLNVYLDNKNRSSLPSIKDLSEKEEKKIICRMLKNYLEENDKKLSAKELLEKYSEELGYSENDRLKNIKKKIPNYIKVFIDGKDQNKLKSIKNESEKKIKENLIFFFNLDSKTKMSINEILSSYNYKDVKMPTTKKEGLIHFDKDTKDVFGPVNTWWVFSEVARKINYKIFMTEVENVGYKRTKRGEKPMPNELYRINEENVILVDDGVKKTALDYLREITWD